MSVVARATLKREASKPPPLAAEEGPSEAQLPTNNRYFIAAMEGDRSKIMFFINRRKVNEQDEHGNTALMHAVFNKKVEATEIILGRFTLSDVNIGNKDGNTALHVS